MLVIRLGHGADITSIPPLLSLLLPKLLIQPCLGLLPAELNVGRGPLVLALAVARALALVLAVARARVLVLALVRALALARAMAWA